MTQQQDTNFTRKPNIIYLHYRLVVLVKPVHHTPISLKYNYWFFNIRCFC